MSEKQTPEMETKDGKSCCRVGHCHEGKHFWIWAAVRIAIVVALIVGAFCVGEAVGSHRGMDGYEGRGGYMRDGGNFRGMSRGMHMMPNGQMMQTPATQAPALNTPTAPSQTPTPMQTGTGK